MRKFSTALVVVGVFLIVLAGMARWYVYPRVAVAPAAQRNVSILEGNDATIFDIGTLQEIKTDLKVVANTVGDVDAAEEAPGNTVVYVTAQVTSSSDGVMRSNYIERIAFDAHTGYAVNCCDEYISTEQGVNTPIKHKGLIVKFPFSTKKTSYQWWDGTLGDAVTMKYVGEDTRHGMKVYKFEGDTPPTKVGTQAGLPAAMLGEPGDGVIDADSMYSNQRTYWVDPRTGVVIDRVEKQNSTLDYNGTTRVTTSAVDVHFTAETVKANVDEYSTLGLALWWLRTAGPILAGIVGLLLIAAGLVLSRRRPGPVPAGVAASPASQTV